MAGCRFLIGGLIVLAWSSVAMAEQAVATFVLRDYVGRQWRDELVVFPVAEKVFGRGDLRLLGPGDAAVAHQWIAADRAASGSALIAFLASAPELGEAAYRLVKGAPAAGTALKARRSGETIVLEDGRIGVTLGGPQAETRGPIAAIRLPGGRTVDAGELHVADAPDSIAVELLAEGPVFAEAALDYAFPDYGFWRLKFRVIAGQAVVLVDEEFQLPAGAKYTLRLADGRGADQLFYRDNGNRCRTVAAGAVKGEPVFRIEPWPAWWGEELKANWVGLFRTGGDDLLALAARDPGCWVVPGRTEWDAAVTLDGQLQASFQLQGFPHRWMLAGMKRADAILDEQSGQLAAPPPQRQLIRHGDFPLDMVKDYTLAWKPRPTHRPRLFTTPAELARFRKRFAVDEATLGKLRTSNIFGYTMDDHVAYYLVTGDAELARKLADFAIANLQQSIDGYVEQQKLRNPGSCPHHRNRSVLWGAIAADLVLGADVLSDEERARITAQLAFLAYTLERPLIISPERGFNANPNMTTMARGMLGIVAATIPGHPPPQWAATAIAEMQHELDEWCGPGGGWLEAPHYATASLDTLIGLALALRDSGLSDVEWHLHPKMRAAVAWLAKISTPPDPRLDGARHMPAIGNTYLGEPTCLPGWMATIWRDEDPRFSRRMQWAWKAQGMPQTPGIGGAYPGLQGYRHVMLDASLPDENPRDQSELFPEAGAVLRAHFAGEHETYLHYIQGKMHQHYDFDEGSFILWGKGAPLCEEFGYYGRAPAADHSRIDDGFYEALGVEGRIAEFAAGESVDYLRGERHGWRRQILFAKDRDPLGPNWFFIRDSVLSRRDFDWRVWIAADEPLDARQNPIRARGRFGVDLAVFFVEPQKPSVTTEQATRTAGTAGWGHDNRSSTQRCLAMKKVPADQPVAVVLFPLMKDEPTPRFTALGGGRVVKIETAHGADYAMLGLERFRFAAEGIEFDGKAAVVQIRADGTRLSLPRRGSLSHRGRSITADNTPERTVTRSFR